MAEIEHLLRGIGPGNRRRDLRWHPLRKPHEIDLTASRMQVEGALCELHELGETAADGDPPYRMLAQILQQSSGEVAHVDHRFERQTVEGTDRCLRRRPGAAGDVLEPGGTRH